MAIDFNGVHYPKDEILFAAFFYIRYVVSYRDLEEIMAERGVGGPCHPEPMVREIRANGRC